MLSLASLQTEDAVRHAFGQFFLWGLYLRGTADVLAFMALIWALSTLHRSQGNGPPPAYARHATHGETR
jgi:hypothetical protein